MIARLKCILFGHKRGKRVGQATTNGGNTFNDYECPRCNERWTRKAKAQKASNAAA